VRFLALLFFVGCGSGIHSESVDNIEHAARTNAMALRYREAGSPASALDFSTYCSLQAVIAIEKLPPFDGGPGRCP